MPHVLVFSGSNSSTSINQRFVEYASAFLKGVAVKIISLCDYQAPLYSMDLEKRLEFPPAMLTLNLMFKETDGMLISLPEYNSGITPVFKNTMDWISRIERPTLKNKPVCLLSTSPGICGARTNLEHVSSVLLPRWGGQLTSSFSLPNFDEDVVNGALQLSRKEKEELFAALKKFTDAVL